MKKRIVFGVLMAVLWLGVFTWMSCRWNIQAGLWGWLLSMLFGALILTEFDKDEPELILEPLTLQEAVNLDVCWIEIRAGYYIEPCSVGESCDLHPGHRPVYIIGHGLENSPLFKDDEYNQYWRCWAEKPTEEDSKAAPWDKEA